jgi:putative sugar O-methyltransferase
MLVLCYKLAELYGEINGAEPISNLEASTVGNPEDIFFIQGKKYTMKTLYYYVQYAYCCKFIDFSSINSLMEIGSGSGKQIEIIKKLHTNITFYILDIPPQLYVCEKYLDALFPNSVVSYKSTRMMKNFSQVQKGKICILGNWKLPELINLDIDLFWNGASFQEMEPKVVLNYLRYVNQHAKFVFLSELMGGTKIAEKRGQHGVLKQTKLEHYQEGLKDFVIQDLSKSIFLPRANERYSFSFWSRKEGREPSK